MRLILHPTGQNRGTAGTLLNPAVGVVYGQGAGRLRAPAALCLLLLLMTSAVAGAAAAQLMNIRTVAQDNRTTLTLQASGAYVHNEYRPNDNLLLVDLTGISPGKLRDRVRSLDLPGVKSYRVVGYTGAGGVEIARLELALAGQPEVRITDTNEGLRIEVTAPAMVPLQAEGAQTAMAAGPHGNGPLATTTEASAAPASSSAPAARRATKPVEVRQVAMVRGPQGMELEVNGTGPLTARTMKLTAPDRVVLDIPNAVAGRARPRVTQQGGVKDVRMAQYQLDPPVTRVVVDLAAAQDYEVVESGPKLVLKLRPASAAIEQPTAGTSAAAAPPGPRTTAGEPETPATGSVPAAKVAEAKSLQYAKNALGGDTEGVASNGGGANSPNEFVFLEPKLAPKAEAAKPAAPAATVVETVEQAARAPGAKPTTAAEAVQTSQPSGAPRLLAANAGPATTPALLAAAPSPGMAAAAPQQTAPAAAASSSTAVNLAAEQQHAPAAAPEQPRYTGEPISVNLKDVDLKDFFRLIHEISGLNIVLDPSVSGSLTLVLDDVPWDQALDIVLKNNGLDRQLEGNVLRIATLESLRKEAQARRAQLEAQALAVDKVTTTRFLSYAHSKDVLPTIKRLLSSRGDIVSDDRTNALIISDIPSVMPAIDRLLAQLDRKTQEVEIEARVVAATRNFARDIGTQLGWGWGNRPTAVGGASAITPGGSGSPINFNIPNPLFLTSTGNPAGIPLFSNLPANGPTSGISFTNASRSYRLDAILTMAESRGLVKILSRPRIITQNNIQAIVKQGTRIPVVTAAQLGGPPTTTYVEALLRLTVTPQITVENTIFLNVDIENTTPDFGEVVAGNPALLTQQATTQVLVTNGGTVVIGGVIQTKNSINVNQVPLLGNIPILGNLFKERSVSTNTQELIFFITPRIVET